MESGDEVGGKARLYYVGAGANLEGFAGVVDISVDGEEDNLRGGSGAVELGGQMDAAETGESYIEDNQVRLEIGCAGEELPAILEGVEHFKLAGEQLEGLSQDGGMIVHQEHARRLEFDAHGIIGGAIS